MGAKATITRFRGDTYPLIVTLTTDGVPVDLTGTTITFSVDFNTPVALVGTLVDAVNGQASFDLDVPGIEYAGSYDFDISVDDTQYITTYVKGLLVLEPDVTV